MHILTLATLFPNAARPNFGVFVERQCQHLAAMPGVTLTIINPIGMPPFPLKYAAPYTQLRALPEQEERGGLNVYRPRFPMIPKIGGAANARNIANAILPMVQRLHAQSPFDLIEAEFFYPDGPAAQRIAKALGLPFTIKARGADVHYWGRQTGTGQQILSAAQDSAAMLAVSEAMKADMTALGMAADKIMVHYTGCDQEKFHPDAAAQNYIKGHTQDHSLPVAKDARYSITVGALIARKNPYLILEALKAVPDLTHVFVGAGVEEAGLKAAAKSAGLADRVIFAGAQPHDALPALLAGAEMLILPSQSEGLANAWVEALACGTPIIISEAGGARELVQDEQCGYIAAQEPEAIAAAMTALLNQPKDRAAIRASVANFTWQRNAEELYQFFTEAIQSISVNG